MLSCKKKWKKPASVTFSFQMNTNSSSGLVNFTSAYFLLNKFEYAGVREQGTTHVDFSKDFTPYSQININPTTPSSGIEFDIPQGTYDKIEVKCAIQEQPDTIPTFIVNGTYIDTSNNPVPVQFIYDASEGFPIIAKNSSGGSQVVFVKDKSYSAKIIFNPKYWFEAIPKSMLDVAVTTTIGGVQTIIISEDYNSDIYQLVAGRIGDGNQLIFE